MTAVDHSKVLTRRRSAMKSERLQCDDAPYPGRWLRCIQGKTAAQLMRPRCRRVDGHQARAVSVPRDGDGVPRNRPRWLMTPAGMPAGICLEAAGRICFRETRTMTAYLWIAFGSALGGVARHWCTAVVGAAVRHDLPLGHLDHQRARLVRDRAVLHAHRTGGSVRRLQQRQAVRDGRHSAAAIRRSQPSACRRWRCSRADEWGRAGGYVAASVVLCLLAVWAGYAAAAAFSPAELPPAP